MDATELLKQLSDDYHSYLLNLYHTDPADHSKEVLYYNSHRDLLELIIKKLLNHAEKDLETERQRLFNLVENQKKYISENYEASNATFNVLRDFEYDTMPSDQGQSRA